jgi:hypothetical protein
MRVRDFDHRRLCADEYDFAMKNDPHGLGVSGMTAITRNCDDHHRNARATGLK